MLIAMWYAISVLAGPRLIIYACVEDSAGKHISGARLGCRTVGFGRWDGARLRKCFSAHVLRMLSCVYLWHYNMFLCLCFLGIYFWRM